MAGPRGFAAVAHYSTDDSFGPAEVSSSGTITMVADDEGHVLIWWTWPTDPPEGPPDETLDVAQGEKVVITPTSSGYSISVVK